jgi:hypothetical protein
MLPPGKIIHLIDNEGQGQVSLKTPEDFSDILVSPKMINDHTPSTYQRVISKVTHSSSSARTSASSSSSQNEDTDNNPSV